MDSVTLTQEQIKKFREWLKEAKPYTDEEHDAIPLDSTNYDWKRMKAYIAKKALQKSGLLEE